MPAPLGRFRVRTSLTFVLAVACGIASVACGAPQSGTRQQLHGRLAVVRGPVAASDRGNLTVISLQDNSSKTVAASVSANDTPTYSSGAGTLLAVRYAPGPSAYAPGLSEIMSYDLRAGTERKVMDGRRPSAYGDALAFCDQEGRLVVMDMRTRAISVVADLHRSSGCAPLAWSHDGRLAFVDFSPLGARPPAPTALFVRGRGGDIRELAIPEARFGAVTISWSSDDKYIAISADGRQIIVKDSATGVTSDILTGDWAAYAPSGSRLAVLQYRDLPETASITVYEGSIITGKRDLGYAGRLGMDWISSDAIALALSDSFAIWRLRDNEFVRHPLSGTLFANIRWIPGP